MSFKKLTQKIGFLPKENYSGIFVKNYTDDYSIEVDFEKNTFYFGGKILVHGKETQNITKLEDWVVFECVDKLLEKGYKPEHIELEKVYPSGHGTSGRLDICVNREDGSEYLLIECKTYGKEFDKAVVKMNKDGGQLFTYFKFSNKADIIMLYASELNTDDIISKSEIVKIEDDYRAGDVKDFYEKWNKLTKDNGVFDSWVKLYNFESKALTINDLVEIRQEDSGFIFNRFLEILRHNVVSDKGNAFNRIFTLFLCKIYDEKTNEGTDNELGFQWLEGIDNHRSFQLRLTDLYQNGMHEFLEKVVTDFSETEFKNKYPFLSEEQRDPIIEDFRRLRLEKNNEFAIKDVYDEQSFNENAVVVKEIVKLLEKFKLRYTKKQQYLSDFFELLLTTGLKQESGQFFTPVPVAQFVIKSLPIDSILENKLASAKIDNDTLLPYVMDFAAGSGHFLTETMHEMQRLLDKKDDTKYHPSVAKSIRNWKDDHFKWAIQYVYGIEKDYRLVKVGKVGCYLHGDGLANVIHSDGLANFDHPDYKGKLLVRDKDFPKENKQFDIIVSNPPYSVSAFKNAARSYYKERDFDLYNNLKDNSSEIECLFIERTKQLLKDGGVAGIILPSSILSNSGIYSKSRELILQYFDIIGITELGSNTFMATGTNTVTLFLRRRNNYVSNNIKIAVNKLFINLQDVTINQIEKPVAKYINHVWEDITFKDYLSLLKKDPNKTVTEHDIYKEYKKKLKAKNDKAFWDLLLERETEKLYYFIIAYPQQVVLIKSGSKTSEKRFLGYEFSNRRGSEGIHPIQRGKNIEDCTKLFDPEIFDNPTKASTYIYKAFQGDFDFKIDEGLKENITRHNLVDMLTFDRVDFEKDISTSIKKKVKIESKWEVKQLKEFVDLQNGYAFKSAEYIQKSNTLNFRQANIRLKGVLDLDYKKTFLPDDFAIKYKDYVLKNGDIVIAMTDMNSELNLLAIPTEFVNTSDTVFLLNQRVGKFIDFNNEFIIPNYLNVVLKSKISRDQLKLLGFGSVQFNLSKTDLLNFQIPLPPKKIQKKIIAEIEVLDKKEQKAKGGVEKLKEDIKDVVSKIYSNMVSLSDITSKIGSGATPRGGEGSYKESGITLIRSQNIYDSKFHLKGLAFIDEKQAKKLDNVTVEKDDILFNITGASIARCCIVPEKYLPARVNQHVSIIRVTDIALPIYVQNILTSEIYKNQLLEIGEGSTSRQAITKSQLEDFKIPLPPLAEQQKIVAEIEKIETKISILEKEIETIPAQKEAVLNKHL